MSGRVSSAIVVSAVLWTSALLGAAAGSSASQRARNAREDISEYLPPGTGKALVVKECSGCHDPAGVVRLRGSKPKWEAVVLDMVARGAPVMIEDADVIINYLAGVFGPDAPPLIDIHTATRDELIKLPGVTSAHADRLLDHRKKKGAILSRDEVREAMGLPAAAFEKIKWYIRIEKTAAQ